MKATSIYTCSLMGIAVKGLLGPCAAPKSWLLKIEKSINIHSKGVYSSFR
ncbi:MAG: hypothetical protein KAR07_05150 [Spirochaetes bacterium]|nr:hypothetical protein [Spirochaetota bacterium]